MYVPTPKAIFYIGISFLFFSKTCAIDTQNVASQNEAEISTLPKGRRARIRLKVPISPETSPNIQSPTLTTEDKTRIINMLVNGAKSSEDFDPKVRSILTAQIKQGKIKLKGQTVHSKIINFNAIVREAVQKLNEMKAAGILGVVPERDADKQNRETLARLYERPIVPYKNRWTVNKLRECKREGKVKYPKGTFPPLEEYLPENYIRSHLSQFDKGAAFFITEERIETCGRDLVGRPDGTQFVMPAAFMDAILYEANGDISKIEKRLGIPPKTWDGKPLLRIDVKLPRKLNLRMANGNEKGANELWLPGGYTPTGIPEAVIDSAPKGEYTETTVGILPQKRAKNSMVANKGTLMIPEKTSHGSGVADGA